ncbi:MAG: NYN domain-containing protein [Thermoleophilaceae bacterium]|nr:NYN domain-containing protein [Thermoleophilaceae bacterium]
MRWLVDGMNVIGSRPDGWWRDRPAAQCRLARELAALAAATGDEVAVVFDGHPHECGISSVDVSFAAGGRDAADDEIARRVEADGAGQALRVVTSDVELASRAHAAGAEVEGSGTFRRRLDEVAS